MSADRLQQELVRDSAKYLQACINLHRMEDTYDHTPPVEWDQLSYAQRRVMQHAVQDLMYHFALLAHKVAL